MFATGTLFSERESLAFRFDEIIRQLSRTLDARLAAHDLSRTQWRLLAYVLKQEGMTQSELAREADLERASIGQAIDLMEKKGMVERRPAPHDRRVWCIFPTEKARAGVPELRVLVDDVMDSMFAGFDGQQVAQLRGLLDRLATNLGTMG